MDKTIFVIAFILSIVAGLLYVAGSESFRILPEATANFSGMIAGGAAAVFWLIYALRSGDKKDKS